MPDVNAYLTPHELADAPGRARQRGRRAAAERRRVRGPRCRARCRCRPRCTATSRPADGADPRCGPQPRLHRCRIDPRAGRAPSRAGAGACDAPCARGDRQAAAYVRGGGKIIAVGGTPSLAPGYRGCRTHLGAVAAKAKTLFASPNVRVVANDAAVGAALAGGVGAGHEAVRAGVRRRLRAPQAGGRRHLLHRQHRATAMCMRHPASFAAPRKAPPGSTLTAASVTAATLPAGLLTWRRTNRACSC
jgi:hypothetical protein